MLEPQDIAELTDWRRLLHRHPEVSGQEAETAARVWQAQSLALCLLTALVAAAAQVCYAPQSP